jgi:hypothetical protein
VDTLATQRLIEATATLDAVDRALLDIWVNESLDDERLAFLTGSDAETLAWRKGRLVDRLAHELGNPAPEIRAALEQLAANTREAKTHADGDVAMVGAAPATSAVQPDDRPGQSSAAIEQPVPERGGGRQRGVIAALAALVLAAVVTESVAATSGGSTRRVVSDFTAAAALQSDTALATPSGMPAARLSRRLVPLPGIRTDLVGLVGLTGADPSIKLKVRLRVPAPRRGHYEVWLYNSILDARALGVPRTGTHTALYGLPSDATRYRWIDISFQPPGAIGPSGESRLRAANPTYRAH